MSKEKSKKKVAKSKVNVTEPNTQPTKAPSTLPEFYAQAWQTLLKKIPKEEREHFERNLKREDVIIRGKPVVYENVRRFVKDVAELGEDLFDKHVKSSVPKVKQEK